MVVILIKNNSVFPELIVGLLLEIKRDFTKCELIVWMFAIKNKYTCPFSNYDLKSKELVN